MYGAGRIALHGVAWAMVVSASGVGAAAGQRAERPWRATARLQAEVRYDDNPFLLTAGRKQQLELRSAADAQSGQFLDMESATDLIPVPSLELGISGPGLAGRNLALEAGVAYEANLENGRRGHAELHVALEQSLSRGRRLRLKADVRPSYFSKNYLQDAVDANGDGTIAPAERRYAAGTSDELELALSYRHRLLRATQRRPVGVAAVVEAGYLTRSFDAPFPGRSRSGPGARAAVALELGANWGIELDFAYASLDAERTREVLILDEPDFGVDLNGNGTPTDLDARAVAFVDRSRSERHLGVSVQGELSGAVTAEVAYGRRTRDFSSTEPFDVANRGRDDSLDEFAAELAVRLVSDLHLTLAARRAAQSTNRAGDPGSTGDVADYTRHVATAGLRYRF